VLIRAEQGRKTDMATASEINLNKNASATQMAETIFGEGVQVTGASYSGSSYSSATYSGGDSITPGVTPGDTGVILSTGSVDYFTRPFGDPNKSNSISVNSGGQNNRADFNAIAGSTTYDAAFLDVAFIPDSDLMTIQFVFSSDEYPEYSNSIYNDVVGVWANGTHIPLSVTSSAAAVTQINQTENINLYNDNTGDDYNTEMDGFTVSNLLIAGNSIQTELVAQQDAITLQEGATGTLDVLANDINNTGGTLVVTHINGNPVVAGDQITLPSGQVVTLNANGTFSIQTDNDNDTISFTYQVASEDGAGNTLEDDVGFVTVETIPCFVAGTLIRTPGGDVPVETLMPGDLVETFDEGAQPVRWAGSRTVKAAGMLAPIRIRGGVFGAHDTLMVSPQHRVLVRDAMAEMLFGEDEVLVAAKDLINDMTIRQIPGGDVTYVHLLFDTHQVVWSNGLATESFLPGPQTTSVLEQDTINEICTLFPELNAQTGAGYSPAARRTLKHFEARVLFQGII